MPAVAYDAPMPFVASERPPMGLDRCMVLSPPSTIDDLPEEYRKHVPPRMLDAYARFPESLRELANEAALLRARHNLDLTAPLLRLAAAGTCSIELHFGKKGTPTAWLRVVPEGASAEASPAFGLSPVTLPERLPEVLRDFYAVIGEVQFGGADRGGLRRPKRHGDVIGDLLCDLCNGDLIACNRGNVSWYRHDGDHSVPGRSPERTLLEILDSLSLGKMPRCTLNASEEAIALDRQLLQACAIGDVAAVAGHIEQGADVNSRLHRETGPMFSSPPLMNVHAGRGAGGIEMGRLLLAHGANPRSCLVGWGGVHPQLPIHLAIRAAYEPSRLSAEQRAEWRAYAALLSERMGGFEPTIEHVDPITVHFLHDLHGEKVRPFLETLLRSKAKRVREKAAELLAR
jgi:hypothetical protein